MPVDENKDDNLENVKESIDNIIGSSTKVKRRKKTASDLEREDFISNITELEMVYERSLLTGDMGFDTSKYDESFFKIIDNLIKTTYGKDIAELIFFYVYDRVDENGNEVKIHDENKVAIPLTNASELYTLVKKIQAEKEKCSNRKK